MKIKKISPCLIAVSGLSMALAGCQSEEQLAGPQGRDVLMTVSISKENVSDNTRTALSEEGGSLNCVWSNGDMVLVTDANGAKKGVLTILEGQAGNPTAQFAGSLSGLANGETDLNFLYLGTDEKNPAKVTNPYLMDHSSPAGTIESLSGKDLLTSTQKVSVADGIAYTEDMGLSRKVAFAHFELIFPDGVNYNNEIVSISGEGLNNTLSLDLSNSMTYAQGGMTIDKKDFYITMLPGNVSSLTFTVEVGDLYFKGVLGAHEWKAGEFVRKSNGVGVPVKMVETEPEPENPGDINNWGGEVGYPELVRVPFDRRPSSEGWAENTRVNFEDFGFTPWFEYKYNAIKGSYLSSATYGDGAEAKYFQWGRWMGFPSSVVYATVNMTGYAADFRYAKYPRGINPNQQIQLYYCWPMEDGMDSRPTYAYSSQVSRWTPQIAVNSSIIFGVNTSGNQDYLPKYNKADDTWEGRSGNPCPDKYRVPTKDELSVFVPEGEVFEGSHAEVKTVNGKKFAMRWTLSGTSVNIVSVETSKNEVSVNDPIFEGVEGITLEACGMIYGKAPQISDPGGAMFGTSFGGIKQGGYWSSTSGSLPENAGYGAWALMVYVKGNTCQLSMEVAERSLGICIIPFKDRKAKSTAIRPYYPLGY